MMVEKETGFLLKGRRYEEDGTFEPVKTDDIKLEYYAPENMGVGCAADNNFLDFLRSNRLIESLSPVCLNLGCMCEVLDGYVNIDYPQEKTYSSESKADVFTDIACLDIPEGSIEEIRVNNIFQRFDRITALSQMIKWQLWLKIGGMIVIETPNTVECAKALLNTDSYKVKMEVIRHLSGDHTYGMSSNADLWFDVRFEHILGSLGFKVEGIENKIDRNKIYLQNIFVKARKECNIPLIDNYFAAVEILRLSIFSPDEKDLFHAWQKKLQVLLWGCPKSEKENR